MKAVNKTILFGRITIERKTQLWPIAVFATPVAAKTYAAYYKMAISSGNVDLVRAFDPQAKIDSNGHIIPGLKLSVATVAYDPSPTSHLADDSVADETYRPPADAGDASREGTGGGEATETTE